MTDTTGSYVASYDPIVADHFINLDPITLMPVLGVAMKPLTTPSGQPINFYVAPPPTDWQPAPDPVPAWQEHLPYIVGIVTIVALIGLYWIIKDKT